MINIMGKNRAQGKNRACLGTNQWAMQLCVPGNCIWCSTGKVYLHGPLMLVWVFFSRVIQVIARSFAMVFASTIPFLLIYSLWISANSESQAGLCMGVWNKLSGEDRKIRDLRVLSGALPLFFTAVLKLLEKWAPLDNMGMHNENVFAFSILGCLWLFFWGVGFVSDGVVGQVWSLSSFNSASTDKTFSLETSQTWGSNANFS